MILDIVAIETPWLPKALRFYSVLAPCNNLRALSSKNVEGLITKFATADFGIKWKDFVYITCYMIKLVSPRLRFFVIMSPAWFSHIGSQLVGWAR